MFLKQLKYKRKVLKKQVLEQLLYLEVVLPQSNHKNQKLAMVLHSLSEVHIKKNDIK